MIDFLHTTTTEAADVTEPVTILELKAYLHIDFTDDDEVLEGMIKSARQTIEKVSGLTLVEKDIERVIKTTKAEEFISLHDTISEGGVTVLNDDADELTADDHYVLRGNILSLYGYGLYTLSYSVVPGAIPQAIKEAIMLEVKERYETKDSSVPDSKGMSEAAMSKIQPYAIPWL